MTVLRDRLSPAQRAAVERVRARAAGRVAEPEPEAEAEPLALARAEAVAAGWLFREGAAASVVVAERGERRVYGRSLPEVLSLVRGGK